jgi:hypothetical protein
MYTSHRSIFVKHFLLIFSVKQKTYYFYSVLYAYKILIFFKNHSSNALTLFFSLMFYFRQTLLESFSPLSHEFSERNGAESRTRTGTDNIRGILSPLRLPIPPSRHIIFLEAAPGFEPGIGVLQTPALPLGYAAMHIFQSSIKTF